jgi:hypothetical protein
MMFREMVNHIGVDVPGMPRLLQVGLPVHPDDRRAAPMPVLLRRAAGEEPIDHTQKNRAA